MALMPRRSRFTWLPSGNLEFELPSRAWIPERGGIGSSNTSAAGVTAGYTVRRDNNQRLTLRMREAEWLAFNTFLDFAQMGETFRWYPDALDAAVEATDSFECTLEEPRAGQKIAPTRIGEYPRVYEVSIVIRGAGATIPWLEFFDG